LVFILLFSFVGEGFIDQHHRDIVFDGIEQATGFADQTISRSIQEDISFTFWAGQNLQKLFTDWHPRPPFLKKKIIGPKVAVTKPVSLKQ
jgi:hypothetical protein